MIIKSSSAIYCIMNKINKKMYVGSAVNFSKRKSLHIAQLKKGSHHSKKLQNSWNKYGSKEFEFMIIESIEKKCDLIKREQVWINFFNSCDKGYNTVRIAGSSYGFRHTLEAKEKIKNSQKGIKKPKGFGEKIRMAHKGRVVSDEIRKKLSISHIGNTHSIETKIKMSIAKIGKKMPEGALNKSWETRRKNKVISICG